MVVLGLDVYFTQRGKTYSKTASYTFLHNFSDHRNERRIRILKEGAVVDLVTGEKRNIDHMNVARYNFGLISFRGCLYAVGGWTKPERPTRTMEKYDPIKNKWSLLPSIQQWRKEAGYAVVGDKICVAGGRDRDCNKLSSVEVFNATTEKWMGGIPEMSKKRSGLSCASLNGELYVLGGFDVLGGFGLVSCEKYNFTTKKWTMLSNMEYPKIHVSTFVFESKIFAIGYKNVEVYDESKDKWTKCEEMAANMPNRFAYRLAAVACVRTDVLKL